MILWNRIGKDIYDAYRETVRLLLKKSRDIYGKDIINKIHDNGETLLHTAVNKGDQASVESKLQALKTL